MDFKELSRPEQAIELRVDDEVGYRCLALANERGEPLMERNTRTLIQGCQQERFRIS